LVGRDEAIASFNELVYGKIISGIAGIALASI